MLQGLKILVLEDNLVIAMDVELVLQDCGADSIETVASVESALSKLNEFAPHVAVLDINLDSGTSLPVADALIARGIPFIFATGYSDPSMLPERLAHIQILQKPFVASALERALLNAVKQQNGV